MLAAFQNPSYTLFSASMDDCYMVPAKAKLLLIPLITLVLLNTYDIYQDLLEADHHPIHLYTEIAILIVSLLFIGFLLRNSWTRYQELQNLKQELINAHTNINQLNKQNEKMRQANQHYSALIQEQMQEWDFTTSEKEVALLLLKGLSFDEIAAIRCTKDKTVRQQATAIYRKAGVTGRHELAAWFFEDFLS
jgi:DNA-binding CsgD family transcriptional regulator